MRLLSRPIALLLLVWYLPACAGSGSWTTRAVVPQETKRTMYTGEVRVQTTDGTSRAFRGVWVSPDSMGGWLMQPAGAEVAFPLADVRAVQVRDGSGRRARATQSSAWLVGGLVGVLLGAALGAGGTYVVCQNLDVGFGSPTSAERDAACSGYAVTGLAYGALVGGVLGFAIGLGISNAGR